MVANLGRVSGVLFLLQEAAMKRLSIWSLALPAFVLGYNQSCAHDWYPITCCSEKDCRPLTEAKGETVLESIEGWDLWDGRHVSRDMAKPSPDEMFHLCETSGKTILCFFAPPGAS
jgi:hypothetical protein